jgi:hypothetical protein
MGKALGSILSTAREKNNDPGYFLNLSSNTENTNNRRL